jgi:hypothetical protein
VLTVKSTSRHQVNSPAQSECYPAPSYPPPLRLLVRRITMTISGDADAPFRIANQNRTAAALMPG